MEARPFRDEILANCRFKKMKIYCPKIKINMNILRWLENNNSKCHFIVGNKKGLHDSYRKIIFCKRIRENIYG